jgi:hypothetical protein
VSQQEPLWKRASTGVLALVIDPEIDSLLGRPVTKARALQALVARQELAERMRRRRWLAIERARAAGAGWTEIDTALGNRPGQAQREYQTTLARQQCLGLATPDRHDPGLSEGATAVTHTTARALTITAGSRTWRRRLGAQAWSALEELALSAHPDEQGWSTAIGVRGVAVQLGITKDTAARAVNVLIHAGLVQRTRTTGPDGRRRAGYRLNLPPGVQRVETSSKPCPDWGYGDQPRRIGRVRSNPPACAGATGEQPTLFEPSAIPVRQVTA